MREDLPLELYWEIVQSAFWGWCCHHFAKLRILGSLLWLNFLEVEEWSLCLGRIIQ